jgi:uncharacterized protein with gpF-like domain
MKYDLAAMCRRVSNPRRKSITIRDIAPSAVMATDLFQSYKPVLALIDRYAALATAEYDRTLSALITDSGDDLTNIFERMGQELSALVLLLRPGLRDWTIRTEARARKRWSAAVLAATNVQIDTMLGPQDVAVPLETALNWNVALVADVGQQAKQKIAAAVFSGLTNRSPARDVAKQIREATGFARDRSLRIASDQLTKLSSSLAEERQRQAGITTVEWRSSHKLHFRPHHAARDGKAYDLDTRTPVDGGEAVAADDWAGKPPFCGCRTLARISFE